VHRVDAGEWLLVTVVVVVTVLGVKREPSSWPSPVRGSHGDDSRLRPLQRSEHDDQPEAHRGGDVSERRARERRASSAWPV